MYRIKRKFIRGYWHTTVQVKVFGIWWSQALWVSTGKDDRIVSARLWIKHHKDKGPHYVT